MNDQDARSPGGSDVPLLPRGDLDLDVVLRQRGLTRETAMTLMLAPLIHVAWADGRIDPEERAAIMAAAMELKLCSRQAQERIELWLAAPPKPCDLEADLEVVGLLLALVPETELGARPPRADRLERLAEGVGRASGGIFGRLFTLSTVERRALDKIHQLLGVDYLGAAWATTLAGVRKDWEVESWRVYPEPTADDALALDPLRFTGPSALRAWAAGDLGEVLDAAALRRRIRVLTMRERPWSLGAQHFGVHLAQFLEDGVVEPIDDHWKRPPYATLYRALANLKFGLAGHIGRILKDEVFCFVGPDCAHDFDISLPFVAGALAPKEDGCQPNP